MTKYIEVLQCNNHISSYLCDVVRIIGNMASKKKKGDKFVIYKFLTTKAVVYPVQGSKDITCRECPKGARFLVRHRKY